MDPNLSIIDDAFRNINQRGTARLVLEECRLVMEEERATIEAERLKIDMERAKLELETARRGVEINDIERHMKMWNQYHTWKQSGDPALMEEAEKLAQVLRSKPLF
jgi:hypothetical protein